MNILNISNEKNEAAVSLTSDELVLVCNALFNVEEARKDSLYYRVYSKMILARDISQYGDLDYFGLNRIAECKNKIKD